MKNRIVYEDKEIIVCHKQAGIPVQSARIGQRDMVSILNNYLAEKGELAMVHVVHRLDQPVEGIVVFAKTKRAAAELSKQIQQGSMRKIYHAVCCVEDARWAGRKDRGQEIEHYTLVDYLVKDGRTNSSVVGKKGDRDAKKAELDFSILAVKDVQMRGKKILSSMEDAKGFGKDETVTNLEENRKYLLAEIELKTGRHHQIRVQMSHAGLPLYGDQKYNEKWQEYLMEAQEDSFSEKESKKNEDSEIKSTDWKRNGRSEGTSGAGLALCAVSLTFKHPVKGKQMTFEVNPENPVYEAFRKSGI